ncbi:Peptidyl-prolyl cis-trans isomerase A precursor [compost metagenome]
MPDLAAEFNDVSFQRGTVGMARAQDPNSANSQFFIDLAPAEFLDGQYTVVGQLVEGWEVLNALKKGDPAANGSVVEPDYMVKVTVQE